MLNVTGLKNPGLSTTREQAAPAPRPVRVQNLLSACARVQTALHEIVNQAHAAEWPAGASSPDSRAAVRDTGGVPRADHPQIAPLLARIRAHAAQVEEICARSDNTPAALPTPSRRAYQWLKYLSVPENLLAQIATMAEAWRIIAQMQWLREREFARYSITFELSHSSYLYNTRPAGGTPPVSHTEVPAPSGDRPEARQRVRTLLESRPSAAAASPLPRAGARAEGEELAPAGQNIRISAAQGFSGAPREVLEALIKASLSRRQRKARAVINAYVSGEDYAETALGFALAAELPQADVRGRHHDLAQSFARVNAAYFAGRLTPPRLTWSRTITKRLMGYYLAERDTLMVSLTLDRADVPAHVVDFVMYHELLHRVLGVPLIDGRRRPHGRAFREAERRFVGYAEADAFLKPLAQAYHQNTRR